MFLRAYAVENNFATAMRDGYIMYIYIYIINYTLCTVVLEIYETTCMHTNTPFRAVYIRRGLCSKICCRTFITVPPRSFETRVRPITCSPILHTAPHNTSHIVLWPSQKYHIIRGAGVRLTVTNIIYLSCTRVNSNRYIILLIYLRCTPTFSE